MKRVNRNPPLVSVILPCYNHEKYVVQAIESILNQTYSNIELIVIDDGSSDNSAGVIEELLVSHKFIFLKRMNKGVCRTLNEGIRLATGKYISLCASDDWYHCKKISTQVQYLEEHQEFALCYSNLYEVEGDSIIKRKSNYANNGDLFDLIFLRKLILPGLTSLIRKDVFSAAGLYDENLHFEDWDMWLRLSDKFRIGYQDKELAYYRIHPNNSHKNTRNTEESTNLILQKWKHKPLYREAKVEAQLRFLKTDASFNKTAAVKRLIILLPYFYKKTFVSALIRLFVPYKLLRLAKLIF